MDGRQLVSLVQRVSSNAFAQWVPQPRGLVQEELRVVRGRQTLQHGPQRRRQPVVNLIAAGPQRVPARRRQSVDLEHRVV